jgi:hypothetical protein
VELITMTVAYDPRKEWAREDLAANRPTHPAWMAGHLAPAPAPAPVAPTVYATDEWSAVLARWAR